MTASEIDAMPAGPEMDALVAEKVMGQEPPHELGDKKVFCPNCDFLKPYSTSDTAALEVLKKAKLSVVLHGGKWIAGHWDQQYLGDFAIDGGFYPQSEGDTIALAVCRASLKTKEKE